MSEEASGIVVALGEDGVQRITIDRADVGNSLSPLARDALTEAFLHADGNAAVRAVLLSAAGTRHFCAGAGLAPRPAGAEPQPMTEKRPGDIARMLQQGWQRLVASVLDCDKPVVAAVKGTAAGAGSSLVLACDLVVMSTEAKLVEAFVHRGILPDSGAIHLLTRIVGLRKATELLMLGEPVDAATCERLGLVNRVVAPDDTDVVAEEIAGRLAEASDLEAKGLFEYLQRKRPGVYQDSQLRTFQRRIKVWQAHYGPDKEIFFPQDHVPGEAMQTDFTWATELNITIQGEAFDHMLCHVVLPYSNWGWVIVCQSESMLALRRGIPAALAQLGRIPRFSQTDNSTSATHKIAAGQEVEVTADGEEVTAAHGTRGRKPRDQVGKKASRVAASSVATQSLKALRIVPSISPG